MTPRCVARNTGPGSGRPDQLRKMTVRVRGKLTDTEVLEAASLKRRGLHSKRYKQPIHCADRRCDCRA